MIDCGFILAEAQILPHASTMSLNNADEKLTRLSRYLHKHFRFSHFNVSYHFAFLFIYCLHEFPLSINDSLAEGLIKVNKLER